MNISIVTVYNSENCGSFLQSYALMKILENEGHRVSFLKRSSIGSSHSSFLLLARVIKYLFRGQVTMAKGLLNQHRSFSKAQQIFNISTNKADMYVIGSDTLWAIENEYFNKNINLYLGALFPSKKSITYAVSAGNTSFEQFWGIPDITQKLERLKAISVRDKYTYELVGEKYGYEKINMVLDPTLLLDKDDYKEFSKSILDAEYILIYTFSEPSLEEWNEIRKCSVDLGLDIITYGRISNKTKWISADPASFISYFMNARYIITDTFHGTIFSMIFHQNFIVLNRNKQKVVELLKQFNLSNRMINDSRKIKKIICQSIVYDEFEELREKFKCESLQYLKTNLETKEK